MVLINNDNMTRECRMRGFTLIELSIVIVLIGLIVAGVVGGQSLIEQAKIQRQISEFRKYEVAYNTFKLEYGGIPGDFNRASDFWGVLDGDGNRRITHDGRRARGADVENKKFFQHLSEAELIDESYNNTWELGVGFPRTELDESMGMIAAGIISNNPRGYAAGMGPVVQKRYKSFLFLNVSNYTAASNNNNYGSYQGLATRKTVNAMDNKIDGGDDFDSGDRIGTNGKLGYVQPVSLHAQCELSNPEKACQIIYFIEK